MNTKVKTEITVGIVLLIAIIVGGIIWFKSKTQEQTPVAAQPVTAPTNANSNINVSGLKTFSNQVIDFSYPSSWTVKATDITPNGFSVDLGVGTINFDVKSNISPNTLIDFEKSREDLEKRSGSTIYNKNSFTIDGKNAIGFDFDADVKGVKYYNSNIYIDAGDYIIDGGIYGNDKTLQETAHTVFHSFKFKDLNAPKSSVTSSSDISTWKTFSNDHLSFLYPPDWQAKGSALKDGTSVGTSNSPDQSVSFHFTGQKLSSARQDIRDWYGFFKSTTSGTISNERVTKIDNLDAKAFDVVDSFGKETHIILVTPNYLYSFGATPNASDTFLSKLINTIKINLK